MRRIPATISIVAASLLISSLPTFGVESTMGSGEHQMPKKDECLLIAKNCRDDVLSIQQKIKALKHEISQGTNVYTTDELRTLNKKLNDARNEFTNMNLGGS